jgi:hypothetical protein
MKVDLVKKPNPANGAGFNVRDHRPTSRDVRSFADKLLYAIEQRKKASLNER